MTRSPLRRFVRAEQRRQFIRLLIAAGFAAATAAGAVLLLGLSGWFLAGAGAAGVAGAAAVREFNYLLPSAGIRFFAILRTSGRYVERVASHEAAFKALARIRPALFAGIAGGKPQQSLALSTGEATGRLVQDVNAIETVFVRQSAPWAALVAALAGAILIVLANPWAALAFGIGFVAQVSLGVWLGARLSSRPAVDMLVANGRLKDMFQSVAASSAELRCFGLGPRIARELMARSDDLGRARIRKWSAEGLAGLAPAAITGTTIATVLGLSAGASLPLATLAVLAATAAMESASLAARMFDDRGAFHAAASRLDEMLLSPPTPPQAASFSTSASVGLHVGAARVILEPGEVLALTGPSGSGKTRVLEMLVGLRPAEPGSVTIGGQALELVETGAARALFSLAPQNAGMISGSVRENLALGDPAATDAMLWAALADAVLLPRIQAMPGGLDGWIGEGGMLLSGGERRRLGLARAYLRPAPWLLLDEPTEGLDATTETAVVAALADRLKRSGQGAVIVSHRPAPLRLCTKTLVLR